MNSKDRRSQAAVLNHASPLPAEVRKSLLKRHPRRCTAIKSNGEPCGAYAIIGGFVCNGHGGRAPQVIQAARERLAFLADPALEVLFGIMYDEFAEDNTRLNAAKAVLDRIGIGPHSKVEVEATTTPDEDLEAMSPSQLRDHLGELIKLTKKLGPGT